MTKLPDFSIRLHGGMTPSQCVTLAQAADSAGFKTAWFAENAFGRGILPTAAACALATKNLRIGAGVFNPFSRHPTMMAMEIGALDELSGGRCSFSIGAGIGSAVEKIGFSAERPLSALRDTIAIVRPLLRGEEIHYEGAVFSAKNVKLDYKPRQGIRLFLAGRGNLTLKLCGEVADGLIISNMCSIGFAKRAVDTVHVNRNLSELGQARFIQYMPCTVDKASPSALIAGMRAVGRMVPSFWSLGQKIGSAKEALLADTEITEEEFSIAAARINSGEDPATVLDRRYVAAFALAGTPEECLAQSMRYAAVGITELALTFECGNSIEGIALLGAALRQWKHAHRNN